MALLGLVALVVVGLLVLSLWLRKGAIKGLPEPPGNFIVGHVFSLGQNFCKTFLRWKELVGPVYQIRIFNQRIVILNDRRSITKVCSMPVTTGRPRFGIFLRIFEKCGEGVANGEGPVCEEQRQFFIKAFKTYGVTKGGSERSAGDELHDMLEDWKRKDGAPFDLESSSVTYAFNTVWSILGSKRLESSRAMGISYEFKKLTSMDTVWDKLALLAMDFVDNFSDAARNKINGMLTLMDEGIKSVAEHQKDRISSQPRDVVDEILDKMEETKDSNSYFHKTNLKHGFMLHEVMAATMDTTTRTLEWFLFYVLQNPQIVAKIQHEIDQVLGPQLQPSLADRDKMPYTQACIWETLRLGTALPLALPHKATEDFDLDGAAIPKGTIMIMNLQGVHRDPAIWDRPEEFDPERLLTSVGNLDNEVKNRIIPFGVGRRMCIGNTIALDTMFLYVTSVFQKFQLELVGKLGGVDGRFGLITYPPPGLKLKAHLRNKSSK